MLLMRYYFVKEKKSNLDLRKRGGGWEEKHIKM